MALCLEVYNEDGDVISLKVEDGFIKIGFHEDDRIQLKWTVTKYIKVEHPTESQTNFHIYYTGVMKNNISSISKDYYTKIIGFLDDQVNGHKLFYSDLEDSYVTYKAVMTWEQVEYLTKGNKYVVYGGEWDP
jgi:hypothetical protein